MNGWEWVCDREEGNQGAYGVEVPSCGGDPDWRVSVFVMCADRVGIDGVDGTKCVVDVGALCRGDEEVDREARFAVFGGERGSSMEFWGVVVF